MISVGYTAQYAVSIPQVFCIKHDTKFQMHPLKIFT